MGNTKSYYIEGELWDSSLVEEIKGRLRSLFSSTYCIVEVVEPTGGYLGVSNECSGPYVVAAIHSFSTGGDRGPADCIPLFRSFRMHRVDSDWSDCWIAYYDQEEGLREWRAHCNKWTEVKSNHDSL